MLKRAHKGTYYKISVKHLDRYVREFAERHNIREHDTIDQMENKTENAPQTPRPSKYNKPLHVEKTPEELIKILLETPPK